MKFPINKMVTITLVALIVLVNLSTVVFAYSFTGTRWLIGSHTGLKYDHIYNSSWRTAIYNARTKWNNVGANIWIEYNTTSDNWVILKAGGYNNNGALMTTSSRGWPITFESDIYVNTNYPWGTTGSAYDFDFESAIIHEMGHYLGLDHSYQGNVMLPTLSQGQVRRNINPDDNTGLWVLYGGR